MSKLPYMPMYWADFFRKTGNLSRSEEYSYLLILAHMWDNGGRVNDDEKQLARIAKLPLTEWRKQAPTVKQYFRVDEGRLTNERLDAERKKAIDGHENHRAAGRLGGIAKSLKNNVVPLAPLQRRQSEALPSISISIEELSKDSSRGAKSARSPKIKTRLSEDWDPTVEDCNFARERGLSDSQMQIELDKFCTHHQAKGSLMANWSAAWRTWVLKSIDFRQMGDRQWRK